MKPMLPIKTKDGVKERHIEVEEEEEEAEEEVRIHLVPIHHRLYLYAYGMKNTDVCGVITLNDIISIACHWPTTHVQREVIIVYF